MYANKEDTTITVAATHVVQCADPDSPLTLPSPYLLGPLDHLGSPAIPVGAVWVYESTPGVLKPISVLRFKEALSYLLDHYPQLTGRLSINPSDGVRSINRLGSGIVFYEAHCRAPISAFRNASTGQLAMTDLPSSGNALLSPWDPSPEGVQRDPLLTVQHTRFECGGVAIGVRLARLVGDASGFLQLYRDLAELYRGLEPDRGDGGRLNETPSIIPFAMEEMAESKCSGVRTDALAMQPSGYSVGHEEVPEVETGEVNQTPTTFSPPPPVIGRELCFSAAELAAIKAHASPPDGSSWVSTFSALSAHLWQCSHKARLATSKSQDSPSPETSAFFTSINFSSMLNLPPRFFPSSVVTPLIEHEASDLATAPLWQVAKAVHHMTRSISPDYVQNLAKWVAAQPQKGAIRQNFPYNSSAFIVTAWNKYSMYAGAEMDIEPTLMGLPFTPTSLVDGLVFLIQGKQATGDIVAAMSLTEQSWAYLDRDEQFRKFRPAMKSSGRG